jgi:hypothetical protein
MLRPVLSRLSTLAALAFLLLAGGCNLDRLEMDDAVVPVAVTAAAPIPEGHEIFRMFEAEKQRAAVTELPMLF